MRPLPERSGAGRRENGREVNRSWTRSINLFDEYVKIMRSMKYAVIFVGLTVLAYFLLIEIFHR